MSVTEQAASALMNNYGERTISLVRGEGVYVYDDAGKQYLDFTAGIAVSALGHAHPKLVARLQEQVATLIHCSNLYRTPWQEQLALRLQALSGMDRVFFCNSGTEANEAAIKLARRYAYRNGAEQRREIVSLPKAFHGRTMGSLSITPKPAYHEGYQPLIPGCVTPRDYHSAVELIGENTAACIVEIVQGEGGVNVVPRSVLEEINARCKETGALFIIDEVQTGVGRCGSFLAYQQLGLKPDIVTMAKGLGGGVPIGAVLASKEVAEAFTPGSHGTTFGGNPLAMAAGLTVTEVVSEPSFLEHVQDVGAYLRTALEEFGREVSGLGLMLGMTVENAKAFVLNAATNGVLLTAVADTRVRLVPPLIVEKTHVDEMVRRLRS
ncbi:aspartate aminotransferase family protein [Alicyclobacillus ferrooxydans]|uniref:Acetylornithine aminotransferase n=1 Tax=Alicyclobacillus ferrooxydans TaxID=471514 RepID=A0A0P9CZX3_9BACL|nr:aspartate aminotransferase family protein [Alicyclobacillus ferrooxydans]KPV45290.1 acetylornithine aminotransferase [Alicyclobacillus ferrooxydans]